MMNKFPRKLILFLVMVCGLTAVLSANQILYAQDNTRLWSAPRLISTFGLEDNSEVQLISDPHGFMHLIWREHDERLNVDSLYYATFDGQVWSDPVDIFVTARSISIPSFSADLTESGQLYLVWSEGNNGPVMVSSVPGLEAGSAQNWSAPLRHSISANWVELQIDSRNVLHLMYLDGYGPDPGVYYTYSNDLGETWDVPLWIDSDIPVDETPNVLDFVMDDQDGLHATWYYLSGGFTDQVGTMVRYTHSLDGGQTWRPIFTIDSADEEAGELRLPYPGLAVSGETVIVTYAGNSETSREYRYSQDRGRTWSEIVPIFGGLHGQALGDALLVDNAGRFHFFGQIRWPQGVYHAMLDPAASEMGWTEPQITYMIAESDSIGRQGRYHAHLVRGGVLNGNELVVTFSDEVAGPIYAMWRSLNDVAAAPPQPTPSPTPPPLPTETPEPEPTPVPTARPFADSELAQPGEAPGIGQGLWLGIVPTFFLLLAVIGWQFFRQRR